MHHMAQQVQLILFQPTYFDLADERCAVKILPPYFSLDRELIFVDWKLATHTK